jgi:hypothetical protein
VSGTVCDDAGVPVEGAVVFGPYVRTTRRVFQPLWKATTDRSGAFELEVPVVTSGQLGHCRDEYFNRFHAEAEGLLDGTADRDRETLDVLTQGGSIDGIAIVLLRPAAIEGVVRDRRGAPVPWATLHVDLAAWLWGPPSPPPPDPIRADGEGRFRIEGFRPSHNAHLGASGGGARGRVPNLAEILRPGQTTSQDIYLEEEEPDASGAGELVEAAFRGPSPPDEPSIPIPPDAANDD